MAGRPRSASHGLWSRGFTVIEILAALALAGVIGVWLVRFFGAQQRGYGNQANAVLTAQNVRGAADMLISEVQNAGLDPRGTAGAGVTQAAADTVAWTADLNADGDADDSGSDGDERVAYFFDRTARTLVRRAAGVEAPVADWVDSLAFRYFDADGAATTTPARVVRVELVMRFRAPGDAIDATLLTGTHLPNRLHD